MPSVLALDTATAELSVAVRWSGGTVARRVAAGRRTGSLLALTVRDVVTEAGLVPGALDAVAVGVGPGPYTSLRAGIMFAKATGLALGVPVIGACSLDVMARGLPGGGVAGESGTSVGRDVVVALDARRREVYWARYDPAGRRVIGPLVGPPAQVRAANEGVQWWGEGGDPGDSPDGSGQVPGAALAAGPDAAVLAAWVAAEWPQAGDLAVVSSSWDGARGDGAAAGQIPQSLLRPDPLYLRRPDAVEPTTVVVVRP